MRKLQIVSVVLLFIAIIGFILWRFFIPFPDWGIRVDGVVMVVALFTSVFSTVKIALGKR